MDLVRYVFYKFKRPFSRYTAVAWRIWYAVEDMLMILGSAALVTGIWYLMFVC